MKNSQQGISMIELMVSMLIGLFLMAGIIQLFIGTKNTYRQVDASARIQENARFAFDFLGNSIRMAGYVDRPDIYLQSLAAATAFPAQAQALAQVQGGATANLQTLMIGGATTPYFAANQVVSGVNNGSLSGAASTKDELLLRYMGNLDGLTTDCRGEAVTLNNTAVLVRYFVDANNNLRCTSSLAVAGAASALANAAGDILIEGVEDMQLLFGVADAAGQIQGYYDPAGLNALSNDLRSRVVAVKVCLQVNSVVPVGDEFNNLAPSSNVPYCGQTLSWSRLDQANKRLHELFSASFELPNVLGVNRSY